MPEPIYDPKGTEITVGARVKSWQMTHANGVVRMIPGGVVTKITEPDVDFNDDSGRAEAFGPFVHVLYDDGEEDRWTAYGRQGWYDAPSEYVCDEIEVEA